MQRPQRMESTTEQCHCTNMRSTSNRNSRERPSQLDENEMEIARWMGEGRRGECVEAQSTFLAGIRNGRARDHPAGEATKGRPRGSVKGEARFFKGLLRRSTGSWGN